MSQGVQYELPLFGGRFVYDAAAANDLAQEGVTARLMVVSSGSPEGLAPLAGGMGDVPP